VAVAVATAVVADMPVPVDTQALVVVMLLLPLQKAQALAQHQARVLRPQHTKALHQNQLGLAGSRSGVAHTVGQAPKPAIHLKIKTVNADVVKMPHLKIFFKFFNLFG
jgi:hypothetical protein